jgi:putative endonuclease
MTTAHVYILASWMHGTLYVGVTTRLSARIEQHRTGATGGFTAKYGVHRLVHVEPFDDLETARHRERSLKRWKRAWKVRLIEQANPGWRDLYEEIHQ